VDLGSTPEPFNRSANAMARSQRLQILSNSPDPFQSTQGQADLPARNGILSRVNADQFAIQLTDKGLRHAPHRGDGGPSTQLNYRKLRGRGFRPAEPLVKRLLLVIDAVAEPKAVIKHQDVRSRHCRAAPAPGQRIQSSERGLVNANRFSSAIPDVVTAGPAALEVMNGTVAFHNSIWGKTGFLEVAIDIRSEDEAAFRSSGRKVE
jgi:hypothetical protein